MVDKVVSVGLPISSHFGTYLLKKRNKLNAATFIADYGDPFSSNPETKIAPYFRTIEKTVLKSFDFITIPIEDARKNYKCLVPESKICVIPQGYDFSEITVDRFNPNEIVSFAYAGMFYDNIRNPLNFLNFLTTIDFDFRFYIFTDIHVLLNIKGVKEVIDLLGEKIILHGMIERKECIIRLSKMDFIVNQMNESEVQKPSKMIDYGLTKRPAFEYSQNNIDKIRFMEYIGRNYSSYSFPDISQYDIRNIVQKFENLDKNN